MPATRPSRGDPSPAAMRLVLTGPSAALHRTGAAPMALSRLDAALLAVARARRRHVAPAPAAPVVARPGARGARNALRQRLFRLRRAAGADVVQGASSSRWPMVWRPTSTMPAEAVNCSADTTTPIAPSCRSGSTPSAAGCSSRRRARDRAHRRLRARRPLCRRRGAGRTTRHRRPAARAGGASVDEAALPRRARAARHWLRTTASPRALAAEQPRAKPRARNHRAAADDPPVRKRAGAGVAPRHPGQRAAPAAAGGARRALAALRAAWSGRARVLAARRSRARQVAPVAEFVAQAFERHAGCTGRSRRGPATAACRTRASAARCVR